MPFLDHGPDRADPASHWQPEGVTQPSAVLQPSRFPWSDATWGGIARQDLVFYEVHVGTFTPEGTFDAIIPRLAALRGTRCHGAGTDACRPVSRHSQLGLRRRVPLRLQHSYGVQRDYNG